MSVYVAYRLGLNAYFKQIEHERIMKRYLDNGTDLVLAGINQASRVFIDNYLKALVIISRAQDGKEDRTVKFKSFNRNILEMTPYYKLKNLVGDPIFGEVSQLLFALVDSQSNILNTKLKEAASTISFALLDEININIEEMYENFQKYVHLMQELEQLSSILEKQTNINWAKFPNFKNLPEVKNCVRRLKDKFETQTQSHKLQYEQNGKQ